MRKKGIKITMMLLALFMLICGCSSSSETVNNTLPPYMELEMPPEIDVQLTTIPSEPIVGQPAIIRVSLLDETKPRDGMRIELRNNSRETRLYDAEEKLVDNLLTYEIEAVFEQSGENLITYHFNVDNYHVMSSISIEVK